MNYGNYPNLAGIKKILVIKLRHHGDVLLTSAVFSALKDAIPDAQIDAYIYGDTAPMLQGHPAITGYLLYDRSWKKLAPLIKIFKELQLLLKVRANKYDLIVNLTEGDRGAIAAFVSGARIKVGFDPGANGFLGKRKVFSHIVKSCPTPRHNVERNLDSLRRIGIFPEEKDKVLTFHFGPEALSSVREKLMLEGWNGKPFIVFHAVSRWRFKTLPKSKNVELVRSVLDRGVNVVMTSSPDPIEMQMVTDIVAEAGRPEVLDLSGKTSLKELGALIYSAQALLTVDSVPLHMGSALKTPMVALFGPTSELNWGPWNHPKSVVVTSALSCRPCGLDGCGGSKKSDCLARISVDEVLQSLMQLMTTEQCHKTAEFHKSDRL